MKENSPMPGQVTVETLHVLADGSLVPTLEAFEKVEDRFDWVDRTAMIQRIHKLREMTEPDKKSLLIFYEKGQQVIEHINLDKESLVSGYLTNE